VSAIGLPPSDADGTDAGFAQARKMRTRLALVTLVLTASGAVLGLPYAPGGATLVFVVAALGAFGTRAGVLLGALALVAGLGTPPVWQPTLMLPAVGTTLAGLGLGLLARELDRLSRVLPSTLLGAALVALAGAATLALPEGRVLLADGDGAPLMLPALVVDGGSFARVATEVPALITHANPGGSLSAIAALACLLASLVLIIVHLRTGVTSASRMSGERRGAWELTALAGALALAVALLGLGQLLLGSGPASVEPEVWRNALDLSVSRDASVVDLAAPASVSLRLWSRPWIDGLRFLPALSLLWLAVRELRGSRSAAFAHELRARSAARLVTSFALGISQWTPIALALTVVGAALIAAAHGLQGTPLALLAGLVLGLGGLVAGRTWTGASGSLAFAPLLALAGTAFVWIYAWLVTPLFGA